MGVHIFKHLIYFPKDNPHFQISMKVLCLVLLIAVAAQAENCQVYKNGIESIFSKMPAVNSASDPNDGVCEDGEGWGCIALPKLDWTPTACRSVLRRRSELPATAGTVC